MIQHIWIQDEIDWKEVGKFYNNIVVKWRGGKVISLRGEYQDQSVIVNFYTKEQSDYHLKYSLWCGMIIQKVICFEDIRYDSAMYLVTRLRSEKLPLKYSRYVPDSVNFVMEISDECWLVLQGADGRYIYDSSAGKTLTNDLYEFL
ncbi:hypothetical protein [Pseudoalteromonas phage PH357]|nr:hypothetical protein [Pseudoalteromonas phage PH357]